MSDPRYLVFVLCLPLCTCGSLSSRVATSATPEAVRSGLDTAASPEGVEDLQAVAKNIEVRAVLSAADERVIDTLVKRLAAPQNSQALRTITGPIAAEIRAKILSEPTPEEQRAQDEAAARMARVMVRSAAEELKAQLPGLVQHLAADPTLRKALSELTKSTAGEALSGAAGRVTGAE